MKGAFIITLVFTALQLACQSGIEPKDIAIAEGEEIARQQLEGGYVIAGNQAIDLGRVIYVFLVQGEDNAKRVVIDAKTGHLIDVRDKTEEYLDAKSRGEAVDAVQVPPRRQAAEQAALHFASGYIRKWFAKLESGHLVFKFKIRNGIDKETRVTIDGETFGVLEMAEDDILD